MKDLLDVRKVKKSKKPTFLRQDAHKLKNLKKNWRRPKGRHSKMRLRFKGYRTIPTIGYSSPKEVRGLNKDGLKEVIVHNLKDLSKLEKGCIAIIGSKVGLKKRLEMLNKIKEMKIACNFKDVDGFIKRAEENIKKKKALAKKKIELKEKSKKEALKKKEKKEEKPSEDKMKEEKRKVLEKKRKGREGEV